MRDPELGESLACQPFRSVDKGDGLQDFEALIEQVAGRLHCSATGGGRVLDHRYGHRRVHRADQASPGSVILRLFADGKGLEHAAPLRCCHGGGDRNRIGSHRHTSNGLDIVVKHFEDRLADQTGAGAVECRLPGIQVPIRDRTAAKCERTVAAQGMIGQVLDEGGAGHAPIVLANGSEYATYRLLVMDLFLIRHGQPDWAPGRIARIDPGLTDLGHRQAERVGHRLSQVEGVDELWASPMNRAMETSRPVSDGLVLDPEVHEWLQEIQNPPQWEGEPAEVIEKALEDANYREMEEMWDGLPQGESFRHFHERVVTGLVATMDSHGVHPADPTGRHLWNVDDPGRRIVIVAHAGTNAVILGHLLGLDPVPWEWDRFRQPHTGVSRLTTFRVSTGWAFSLRQLGDVTHLHPTMVTA